MKLNNSTYDIIKWVVSIVLPALAVLVGGLGKVYGYEHTDMAVTTITAVTTFLGTIMQVSNTNYKKNGGNK
ncbi:MULTISPECIES: phage holin [unclassified Enterococcus]|uniref:phage holin n=1 Tax=unclassified Enterococcus TaxID=2608891 RepID=UPI0013EA02D3|nr:MULTISPECIES: phage holin [unclassified Enterococcus]